MQTLVESSQGKAMGVEEDRIPIDPSGRPDLSYYTRSAEYYAAMHARAIAPGGTFAERTHGCWGLIAKGEQAIPHALAMIASTKPDAREDGAAILAEIGKGEGVVQSLLGALAAETDVEARDSLIQALGGLRNRAAIPALAALIEDEDADGDTRWTAVESLGRIVRRRFLDKPDPVAGARDWIAAERRRKAK
jgi:HEAT repeat protein